MHHEEQRAAAVMQRCLGRIGNTKYAQAWQQWVHANAAMVRAGCTMQQVLRRLSGHFCGHESPFLSGVRELDAAQRASRQHVVGHKSQV